MRRRARLPVLTHRHRSQNTLSIGVGVEGRGLTIPADDRFLCPTCAPVDRILTAGGQNIHAALGTADSRQQQAPNQSFHILQYRTRRVGDSAANLLAEHEREQQEPCVPINPPDQAVDDEFQYLYRPRGLIDQALDLVAQCRPQGKRY